MKKIKVVLYFIRLGLAEKIGFYRNVINRMTNNPEFPSPDVSLLEAENILNTLEQDNISSKSGDHALVAKVKQSKLAADNVFRKIARYVDRQANGNAAIILDAGFQTSKQPRSRRRPIFSAEMGDSPGEILLIRKGYPGAKSYVWQYSPELLPENEKGWLLAGVSTKARYTVKDLESGMKYWLRVSVVTSKGMQPWSDPVMKVAP